jgi:Flp pilus assembly protein TadG
VKGRRPDVAQSTVELALVLPVLALFVLLIVQIGLVVRAQVLVTHAAREAARVVAVTNDPGLAGSAANGVTGLDPGLTTVSVEGSAAPGSDVTVVLEHRFDTAVPLIGALLGDVTLEARATMRAEG